LEAQRWKGRFAKEVKVSLNLNEEAIVIVNEDAIWYWFWGVAF